MKRDLLVSTAATPPEAGSYKLQALRHDIGQRMIQRRREIADEWDEMWSRSSHPQWDEGAGLALIGRK